MVGRALPPLDQRIDAAAQAILDRLGARPRAAFLLGTGPAPLADHLAQRAVLAAAELPEGVAFAGQAPLIAGRLAGLPVVLSGPSLPYHTGRDADALAFPLRVLARLGAEVLVLTAGAASLVDALPPGAIALIEDHLDHSATHVLRTPALTRDPRFLDQTDPYPARWRALAQAAARGCGIACAEAVFAAVSGPELPTRAECRLLRAAGVDLVGMSLVPDVLVARHAGCEVLAFAAVTQRLGAPADVAGMLAAADAALPNLTSLLVACARALAEDA